MKKILVIDDNAANRELIVSILGEKVVCDQSETGKDGVRKFTDAFSSPEPFDLVLLDIGMPDINGLTVLFEIRQLEGTSRGVQNKQTPVVIITAYTVLSAEAQRLGCTDYLVKPILPRKLFETIEKYLGPMPA
ncbi:MAG: response regulator [Candidatus Omnitrophota bacterium]